MARCTCSQATCQCVLMDSATIDFSGAGSAGVPYTGTIIPTGVAPLLVSADAPNALSIGTDGLLVAGATAPRALFVNAANHPSGGALTTLLSFVVPGGLLAANGDRLRWRAMLDFNAALFDFQGLDITYGGVTFAFWLPVAALICGVALEGEIIRTGAATQRATSTVTVGVNPSLVTEVQPQRADLAANNAANQTFAVVASSTGALANETILRSLTADYMPAP